ncbi:MAG: hypothetical protein K8S14_10585, partial [Actinomycetia bacterium]|nr:hypothetical protein [Actinomycetes bacterium]
SNGDDYDISYKFMFIMFSKTDGSLDIIEQTNSDVYEQHLTLNNALNKINTSSDEFGPNIIYHGLNVSETTYTGNYKTYVFLYSNNSNGNQNIMFTHNYANENFEIPIEVEFLNSDYNDAYPTFNKDNSEIYFTSDRNGIYNIHKTEVNNTNGIIEILTDNSIDTIKTDTILSSINNDKCPYILNDFIVFASDRDGGFGGYDLYYSFKKDGGWIEPINFGNKINTEFDEFRPIVRSLWDFSNDFMLFSSNRPGGKGGFDLYYVGIDKINNDN